MKYDDIFANAMTSSATASTAANSTLTLSGLIKGLEEAQNMIDEMKRMAGKDWILISPTGEVVKGTVQQLTSELMKHHPLFKDTFSSYIPYD